MGAGAGELENSNISSAFETAPIADTMSDPAAALLTDAPALGADAPAEDYQFKSLKDGWMDEEDRELDKELDAQIARDLNDDAAVASPRPTTPGGITPLGVRLDRGQGPLVAPQAKAAVDEIDTALSSLTSWQKQRKDAIAALEAEYAAQHEAETAAGGAPEGGLDGLLPEEFAQEHAALEAEIAALRREAAGGAGGGTGEAETSPTKRAPARALTGAEVDGLFADLKSPARPPPPARAGPGGPAAGAGRAAARPGSARNASGKVLAPEDDDYDADLAEADALLADTAYIEGGVGGGGEGVGGEGGEDRLEEQLVGWAGDLSSVLSKMDALQTGYQANK